MKLQNRDIQGAVRPLQELINEEFPVLTSYALVKLVNRLNEPLKIIEDTRQGLIRKYHTKEAPLEVEQFDKNGKPTEQFVKFNDDFNALMDEEIYIEFQVVTLPMNVNGNELRIKPASLMALEKFVVFEGADAPAKKKATKKSK